MRPKHYSNPFAAFSYAKILAKCKELDDQRFGNPHGSRNINHSPTLYSRPLAHSTPNHAEVIKDSIYRPHSRQPGDSLNTPTPKHERYTHDANSQKVCRYCKNSGHDISECRKRQYNNSRSGNEPRPSRSQDEPRAGPSRETPRPVQTVKIEAATTE